MGIGWSVVHSFSFTEKKNYTLWILSKFRSAIDKKQNAERKRFIPGNGKYGLKEKNE